MQYVWTHHMELFPWVVRQIYNLWSFINWRFRHFVWVVIWWILVVLRKLDRRIKVSIH